MVFFNTGDNLDATRFKINTLEERAWKWIAENTCRSLSEPTPRSC